MTEENNSPVFHETMLELEIHGKRSQDCGWNFIAEDLTALYILAYFFDAEDMNI